MSELIGRAAAAQATLKATEFRKYRLGRADCARMTAMHLRRMGHQVVLPPSGSYSSAKGALRELKARGFASMPEAMDAMGFERIAPAAALPGDVVALPSASPIGCLTVVLSNGRVCGFLDDVSVGAVLQPVEYAAAWRVPYARAAK